MRRSILAAILFFAALPIGATATTAGGVRAGYGYADATWHVGAGSGQYAAKDPNAANLATGGEVDPFNHGVTQRRSYGVQSRLSYRTIVVEGTNGKRIALVKTDHYLAQDLLIRRAAQILAAKNVGIAYDDIMLMASHNHSSPYYTTPSWGVWLFQDMFDIRAFEYESRKMAASIEAAVNDLQPARMGATTVQHSIYKGNIAGSTLGDDGTPAGYPDAHADFGLSIIRFDNADTHEPIAVLANFGQHPESNDGYDLITADFLAPLERMVERDTGAPLVFGQADVGSAEGPYFRGTNETVATPDGPVVRAWAHVGHAQTERGARFLADSVVQAFGAIGTGNATVPFTSDFPVAAGNAFVPGPVSHPYPAVSNCRTEPTAEGNYGAPVAGLPDCARAQGELGQRGPDAIVYDLLKEQGIPVPEHYDAPAFTAVEENLRLKLQAFRMGEVLLASCACEAQMDLILNLESRTNLTQGDMFVGYEYPCVDNGNGSWTCQHGSALQSSVTVSDAKHARMVAQVRNDAAGWNDPTYAVDANAEPIDPAKIKGNFTHTELPASLGYAMPIGLGHSGDYNGYTVSYREFMIRDHYRKALTSYGSHTADYMATRLMELAGSLKGGPLVTQVQDPIGIADEARMAAQAASIGAMSSAIYDTWLATLPSDIGPAAPVTQPSDVARFNAATFTWRGGSNATDNPIARVERLVDGNWTAYADMSGEVQTKVRFPSGATGAGTTYAGQQEWLWTANFEAFDAFPRATVAGGQVPNGTYRFVVDGAIKSGLEVDPYHLTSAAFTVRPWSGIVARDPQTDASGNVSFLVDPIRYPRTYTSAFRFVKDDGNQTLCKTCSFRPWASKGSVAAAVVHVERFGGGSDDVPATFSAGRWRAATALGAGDTAILMTGGVVDTFGEINGSPLVF